MALGISWSVLRFAAFAVSTVMDATERGEYGHLSANEIGGQRGQPIVLALCPAVFDRDILVFEIADFVQAPEEAGRESCKPRPRRGARGGSGNIFPRLAAPKRRGKKPEFTLVVGMPEFVPPDCRDGRSPDRRAVRCPTIAIPCLMSTRVG